jgi:hypothetical protein
MLRDSLARFRESINIVVEFLDIVASSTVSMQRLAEGPCAAWQRLVKHVPAETRRKQQYSYNGNGGVSIWSVPRSYL